MTLPNLSILIVEDVQAMRFHLRQLLQEVGFSRVQTAASLEEAQLVLMVEVVDVILCDWYLNPGSGLDLLQELRAKPQNDQTAFLMLTAENTKEKVLQALQAGVDDYMMKPISAAALLTKIQNAAARRKSR